MTKETIANFQIADTAKLRMGDTLRGCVRCAGTGKLKFGYCQCKLGDIARTCDDEDRSRREAKTTTGARESESA